MSSAFCSLEDAFAGPVMPAKKKKTRGSGREAPIGIETFVPSPLPGIPQTDPDRQILPPPPAEVLKSPSGAVGKLESAIALQEFFPLPGETAAPEEWQKAFTLEPSILPRIDGSVAVDGQSTLWRQIPVPRGSAGEEPTTLAVVPPDVHQRLDALTRQLESLTAPTPLQSTAELFLFVAIGLLVLLAMDTLLRFATSMATRLSQKGGTWRGRIARHLR